MVNEHVLLELATSLEASLKWTAQGRGLDIDEGESGILSGEKTLIELIHIAIHQGGVGVNVPKTIFCCSLTCVSCPVTYNLLNFIATQELGAIMKFHRVVPQAKSNSAAHQG